MQAIGYTRVSTEAQAISGESLKAQRKQISDWCKSKGYQLTKIYSDEGISGKKASNRPGFKQAIDHVCQCKGALVIYDLTRLARSTRDAIDIVAKIRRASAQLGIIMLDIDTSSPLGEFFFTTMAAIGQLERQLIVERTKSVLGYKRANGIKYTKTAPYGYSHRDRRIIKNRKEQDILAKVKVMRTDGMGYKAIARKLDQEGIKPRNEKAWNWSSVRSMLTNRMRQHEAHMLHAESAQA